MTAEVAGSDPALQSVLAVCCTRTGCPLAEMVPRMEIGDGNEAQGMTVRMLAGSAINGHGQDPR